jgi:hypothetical protein
MIKDISDLSIHKATKLLPKKIGDRRLILPQDVPVRFLMLSTEENPVLGLLLGTIL